ncbi:MAG: hypothetical protein ACI350_01585 [Prevotella sp.]
MYRIQANPTATRNIEVSEQHLATIRKYALFQNLAGSTGIIDESVLDRLKLTLRSLLGNDTGNNKELLDLCLDVIYNNNMKAFGLTQLVKLYTEWLGTQPQEEENGTGNVNGNLQETC